MLLPLFRRGTKSFATRSKGYAGAKSIVGLGPLRRDVAVPVLYL